MPKPSPPAAVSEVIEVGVQERRSFAVRPYRPARWLAGGHLQTLGGWLLRPRGGVSFRRERIDTPDGDFIDLDFATVGAVGWSDGDEAAATRPIAIVLHGLEGSTESTVAQQTFRALAARDIRSVGINFRSCSGEPNRTARFYHAGETGDFGFVLELLAERFPEAPFGAVGYSLGGNVLLKYLGERGGQAAERIRAAAAVSVPFDLAAGARNLEGPLGRRYTEHFLRRLRAKYERKAELVRDLCDPERVRGARSFRDFDDAATAPLHGFASAEEYYAYSSSGRYLASIRVPTLLLHADDDPFLPAAAVPREAPAANPYLVGGFTRRGGHVGFVSGTPWAPEFWAEAEAARFLGIHLAKDPLHAEAD